MEVEDARFYACPCCGYGTLSAAPPGSYIVCPICCWEDLPLHAHRPEVYCVAIRRAQRSFLRSGVSDPRYRELACPPGPDDRRAADWQPIETLVETIVQQIGAAFAEVAREDGITIHEADVLDSYGSDEQLAAARQRDRERHWSEVPEATIERHWTALSFLDDKGFLYYLPAYLSWTLRHYASSDSPSPNALLVALTVRPWDDDSVAVADTLARFRLLSTAQAESVCRALRFLAAYGYPCINIERARRALDHYWGRFCPDQAHETL